MLLNSWAQHGNTAKGQLIFHPGHAATGILHMPAPWHTAKKSASTVFVPLKFFTWSHEYLQPFLELRDPQLAVVLWECLVVSPLKFSLTFRFSKKHILVSSNLSYWISEMTKLEFGCWIDQCCLGCEGGRWCQYFIFSLYILLLDKLIYNMNIGYSSLVARTEAQLKPG